MTSHVLLAGGGIGGLAAAVALARARQPLTLIEQADAFGEVGAGLQLGPNAVRLLADWGLRAAIDEVAAWPESLAVRDARHGQTLGQLRLDRFAQRHRAPYACLHRADLHALLLRAAQREGLDLRLASRLESIEADPAKVQVRWSGGGAMDAAALIGCDGLWSRVRGQVADPAPPRPTGHVAYRGLLPGAALPAAMRALRVGVWLGTRLHVVHYPVRGGAAFNLVAVVHAGADGPRDARSWSEPATRAALRSALGPVHGDLGAWLDAVPAWTRWVLHDRPPLAGPQDMARGRVALLGDAAHPMRPYLAQGAAMAIEDAWALGRLAETSAGPGGPDWPAVLARYADVRWARNARVQRRSRRNGTVFHASGPLRWARNAAMALLGERLLDNGWLYDGPGDPVPGPGSRSR